MIFFENIGKSLIVAVIVFSSKIESEYDQDIPQLQTADNPVDRKEEPLNHHKTPGRQIKHSNQLSFPHQKIAILEWTKSNVQQNIEQLRTPTMRVTINKKSTTTEPLP